MTETLLITGGAIGDLEVIEAAKELGYFVITSGNRPNDPGHKIADTYIQCDYTDVAGLIEICKANSVKVIIPSAHDLAAVAAAKVAFELSLPGYDSPDISRRIHSKSDLRKLWSDSGGRVPRFVSSSSVFTLYAKSFSLKLPLIVKPTNLTGGAGISITRSRFSLFAAIRNASNQPGSQGVIVEEFLEGTNHGLSCLLIDQKIVFSATDDEFHIYDDFRVSATTFPSRHNIVSISPLLTEIEQFAIKRNLVDGIFHTQYLMTNSGPVLLEACRRTPGDAYTRFVSLAFGFNYAVDIVLGFAGKTPHKYKNSNSIEEGSFFGRFVLMPSQSGIFESIKNPEISKLLWASNFRHSGDVIVEPRTWTARIFIIKSHDVTLDEFYYRRLAMDSSVVLK